MAEQRLITIKPPLAAVARELQELSMPFQVLDETGSCIRTLIVTDRGERTDLWLVIKAFPLCPWAYLAEGPEWTGKMQRVGLPWAWAGVTHARRAVVSAARQRIHPRITWQTLIIRLRLFKSEFESKRLRQKLNQKKVELAEWAKAATPDQIEKYKLRSMRRIGECKSQGDEEGVKHFSEMLAVVEEHSIAD